MKKDSLLAAPCGIYCGECPELGKQCEGCGHIEGKPFWAASFNVEVCPLYVCPVTEKKLEHCGQCETFPCDTFLSMRDPSMTDAQFEESLSRRQAALRRRKEVGTEAWMEEASGK